MHKENPKVEIAELILQWLNEQYPTHTFSLQEYEALNYYEIYITTLINYALFHATHLMWINENSVSIKKSSSVPNGRYTNVDITLADPEFFTKISPYINRTIEEHVRESERKY